MTLWAIEKQGSIIYTHEVFAQFGHRFLNMYLDRDDSLNGNKWDDVVANADTKPP
jgi:hypothetical protein